MSRSRGQIEQRGPGKFRVRVYIGTDGEGKRLYRSEMVLGNKTEAKKVLSELLVRKDNQGLKPRTTHTVATWGRLWVEDHEGIAQSTRRNYRYALKTYIEPRIGGLKLHNVSTLTIKTLIKDLKASGYKPATVTQAKIVLGAALKAAVGDGLIQTNPCTGIKTPKIDRVPMKTLTRHEVALFLETAWAHEGDHPNSLGHTWPTLWTLMLTSGLRPGEALALQWADLTDGVLSIHQTLRQVSAKVYEIVEGTKTNSSRRTVALPQTTLEALQSHKADQAQRILRKGAGYDREGGLVFAGRDGSSLHPTYVSKKFKATLGRAGLDTAVRLYDTRHTHATHLLANGTNPKVVADRMGHESVTTTLDVYSHVSPEIRKETALEVERMLFG